MIGVVNYGMGNIGSVCNMLRHMGAEVNISGNAEEIRKADKLVIPGVGSFDHAMNQLRRLNLVDALNHKVKEQQTPVLGICLGHHLLGLGSEEGSGRGLAWIRAYAKRFKPPNNEPKFRVPHMGWNTIKPIKGSGLMDGITEASRFYFAHSFYLECEDTSDIAALTHHGTDFVSVVQRENIFGVQFHPEKSHVFGCKLIHNFVKL